ncbi:hypothetical protein [uncultured Bacteroides sp.]|uniref:hypothetical protein n=1 Tax=uncultured Bacteroides sp. TaxID=162156 RepID=UPI002AAB75F3|nr:hypothetical protein [uncultured Bacteroides sp.]
MMQPKKKQIISVLLYPLLFLLLINCPIKQEIKQQLGVPVSAHSTMEKPNQTRYCTFVLQKTNKVVTQQEETPNLSSTYMMVSSFFYSLRSLSIFHNLLYSQQSTNLQGTPPLFLLFRTLLI